MFEVKQIDTINWQQEQDRLEDDLYPLILLAALDGAQSALAMLPPEMAAAVDWQIVEAQVTEWARQHAHELAVGITATSEQALHDLIQQGLTPEQLIERLAYLFGEVRASLIGITETTQAFAQANIMAWIVAGGVTLNRWNTARDDRVCPICQPHEGEVSALGMGFGDVYAPPAHASCRCWLSPVL